MAHTKQIQEIRTYALICHTFGRKFSFNAVSKMDAVNKMREWCRYHSHSSEQYHVHQIPNDDTNDLHNEYFD